MNHWPCEQERRREKGENGAERGGNDETLTDTASIPDQNYLGLQCAQSVIAF